MIKHTYKVSLKEFLKLFKCLASSSIHTIFGEKDKKKVGSPLQSSSSREKDKKGQNSHKACMGTLDCGYSPPISRHLICTFFIKTLIIMPISTNIHRTYVCDPLDPYISLVNNSMNQITPYWSTLINYPYQHID